MIPIGALFSKIKIFESCTCGGAQWSGQLLVNEPPYHMYVLNTSH